MAAQLINIDGPRNVGKSFLINNSNLDIIKYKFPYAKYYNESFKDVFKNIHNLTDDIEINSRLELFYFGIGFNLTILDLLKQGIITENILADRGLLSDIIHGILANRITIEEGLEAWKWLNDEYGEFFETIYLYSDINTDNRNKDDWDKLYDQKYTMELYQKFISLTDVKIYKYKNEFTDNDIHKFKSFICDISVK